MPKSHMIRHAIVWMFQVIT